MEAVFFLQINYIREQFSFYAKDDSLFSKAYFAEVVLYSNWIQPFGSIPGNILQVVIAGIIVVPLVARIKKRVL